MKKAIIIFLCYAGISFSAFSQMPKWCIPPYLIGFSPAGSTLPSILASNLSLSAAISATNVSNAAYDNNGNVLFYVTNAEVLLPNGTSTGIDMGPACGERAIVAVPGFCNRFYIIYIFSKLGRCNLRYTMVEVNSGVVTTIPGFADVFVRQISTTGYGGLAVSKVVNKTRTIFTVGNSGATGGDVHEFSIESNGITVKSENIFIGHIESPTEVELYENATSGLKTLAWGGSSADQVLHLVNFSANGINPVPPIPFAGVQTTYGVEFFDNGTKVFVSQDNSVSTNKGLAVVNLSAGSISFIPSSQNYFNSQIEKATDGKYYCIGQGNEFSSIDPVTLGITNVLTLTGYPTSPYGKLLPDQVDDESYNASNFKAELIVRDAATDIGIEPNPDMNVWTSPDLWNRRDNNGNPNDNQDPGYGGGGGNLMKVRIKNVGCVTSQQSHVRLYWTLGQTGEHWPNSWNGVEKINNVAAGAEIQSGNWTVSGYEIGPLGPGAETIVQTRWLPPNPASYEVPNQPPPVASNAMICFLARIDDPANEPMYGELSSPTTSTGYNIRFNNNIATRNSNLTNLSAVFRPAVGGGILVSNYLSERAVFNVRFRALTANDVKFADLGRIRFALSERLWNAWTEGGRLAEGVVVSNEDAREVEVRDLASVVLKNIAIDPDDHMGINPSFELTTNNGDMETYSFAFSQEKADRTEDEEAYGSECVFIVTVNGEEQTNEGGTFERQSTVRRPQVAGDAAGAEGGLLLYPNPSNDMVTISFAASAKDKIVNVRITDLSGKLVQQSSEKVNYQKSSSSSITINTKAIKSGVYIVSLQAAGSTQSAKLKVLHQ
jgi:hypothetical protein